MAEKWRGTKEPLYESVGGEWKSASNYILQKTKIMASGPITSWQTEGEKLEVVTDFLFLVSKITAMVTAAMKSEDVFFWAGKRWQT